MGGWRVPLGLHITYAVAILHLLARSGISIQTKEAWSDTTRSSWHRAYSAHILSVYMIPSIRRAVLAKRIARFPKSKHRREDMQT
jgi:hypothetical protein